VIHAATIANARSRAIRVPQRRDPISCDRGVPAGSALASVWKLSQGKKVDCQRRTGAGPDRRWSLEIAPGIRRLGHDSIVNAYLVEDWHRSHIVDAGLSGCGTTSRRARRHGRTLDDIRAIVLTHGHSDHIGLRSGGRVGARLAGQRPRAGRGAGSRRGAQPAKGGGPMRPASFARVPVVVFWRHGARTRPPRCRLDLLRRRDAGRPGSPRVTLRFRAPYARQRGPTLRRPWRAAPSRCRCALTRVTTGRSGPQIAPFSRRTRSWR